MLAPDHRCLPADSPGPAADTHLTVPGGCRKEGRLLWENRRCYSRTGIFLPLLVTMPRSRETASWMRPPPKPTLTTAAESLTLSVLASGTQHNEHTFTLTESHTHPPWEATATPFPDEATEACSERSSDLPHITQLIGTWDLRTQGCSAPDSISFLFYYGACNNVLGPPKKSEADFFSFST